MCSTSSTWATAAPTWYAIARLCRLTLDHTWAQEAIDHGILTPEAARVHPNRNVIKRYVGVDEAIAIDPKMIDIGQTPEDVEGAGRWPMVDQMKLLPGDTVLLCSDGLTDELTDDELQAAVRKYETQAAADQLVAMANAHGGRENITVVLLRVPGGAAPVGASRSRGSRRRRQEPASTPDYRPRGPAGSGCSGGLFDAAVGGEQGTCIYTCDGPNRCKWRHCRIFANGRAGCAADPGRCAGRRRQPRSARRRRPPGWSPQRSAAGGDVPTSTPIPTRTPSPIPPTATPVPTTRASPTTTTTTATSRSTSVAPGSVTVGLVSPNNGDARSGDATFSWTVTGGNLSANQAFEVIIWKAGQDAMRDGRGLAEATRGTSATVDLAALDDDTNFPLEPGEYLWGVRLVESGRPSRLVSEPASFASSGLRRPRSLRTSQSRCPQKCSSMRRKAQWLPRPIG